MRYDYIDFAKGIAIFLMVLLHTTSSYPYMSSFVGAFHMAVFFFIAGIFAKGKEMPVRRLLRKGWDQLMVPYFSFSTLAFTICWISPYLHPELYTGFHGFLDIFKGAFIGMFMMQDCVTTYSFLPLGPLWFLPALFWCKIFFILWSRITDGKVKWIIRLTLLSIITILVVEKINLFSLSSAVVSFPFFLMGYYCRSIVFRYAPKNNGKKRAPYVLIGALAFLPVIIFSGHGINNDGGVINGNFILAYLRGICGVVALLSLAMAISESRLSWFKSGLSLLGQATIAVLGLHFYFLIAFKVVYVLIGYSATDIHILYALPAALINVVGCSLIYKYILIKYLPWAVGKTKEFGKGPVL